MSGTPATHQWVQSIPLKALKLLGCPSFLNCDNLVMLSNDTGFLTPLKTCSTTISAFGHPPLYVDPFIGSVSFPQFVTPGSFQSAPLNKFHFRRSISRWINTRNEILYTLFVTEDKIKQTVLYGTTTEIEIDVNKTKNVIFNPIKKKNTCSQSHIHDKNMCSFFHHKSTPTISLVSHV